FIISSVFFAKLMSENPSRYLSLNSKPPLNFITLLPFFSMSGLILVSFMGELNMKLNLPEVFNVMEDDANELINYIISFKSSGKIFATILLMALLPAIGEELFFRGIVQKILIKWTKKNWVGILITAFIFSAIHMQFLTFLPRFFMGIMLGYLFVWSRNLLIPIIAHLLHNLISILVAMNSEIPEIENPEFNNLWLVIVSFVIIALISYRYYSLSRKTNV
ncbi:MAG: membrane protease YdiL (CAAX protease family), partial [Urechidicola sp.]